MRTIAQYTDSPGDDAGRQADPRRPALRALHAGLAREALSTLLARRPVALQHAVLSGEHDYVATLTLLALFYVDVEVDFVNHGQGSRRYRGQGGGAILGGGNTIGTAHLARPLDGLVGTRATFELNLLPFAVNLNWWDEHGALGAYVGGGMVGLIGLSGGSGDFESGR